MFSLCMYDVIIAGSGIAGSTIARGLGELDVLVLEKNKKAAPKDSGIVSRRFLEHYDRKFIRHEQVLNEKSFVTET